MVVRRHRGPQRRRAALLGYSQEKQLYPVSKAN